MLHRPAWLITVLTASLLGRFWFTQEGNLALTDSLYYLLLGLLCLLSLVVALVSLKVDATKLANPHRRETAFLLGSGGHTGELCQLIANFRVEDVERGHVITTQGDKSSSGFFRDTLQSQKAKDYESIMEKTTFYVVSRTNQVKQSYLTAVFTGLRSLASVLCLVMGSLLNATHFVCNGPGTCLPFIVVFRVLRVLGVCKTMVILVESWCRVERLSLTGKLARPLVDHMVVHWPELA